MYRYIPFFIATLLFLSCASKKAVVSPISVDSYVDTTKYTKTHNLSVDKHVNNSCVVFDADSIMLTFPLNKDSTAQVVIKKPHYVKKNYVSDTRDNEYLKIDTSFTSKHFNATYPKINFVKNSLLTYKTIFFACILIFALYYISKAQP